MLKIWVLEGKVEDRRKIVMDGALFAELEEFEEVLGKVEASKHQQGTRYQVVLFQCQVWRLRMLEARMRMVLLKNQVVSPTWKRVRAPPVCLLESS